MSGPGHQDSNETPEATIPSPYVGLVPFGEHDSSFFFGRDGEREIITANLMASRLTLLYGASGVGKTSVLNAGVVNHLRQLARRQLDSRRNPEFAVVVLDTWRDNPVAELLTLARSAVSELASTLAEPAPPSPTLTAGLRHWVQRLGGYLFVILDQFEEYFVYHESADTQDGWAAQFPVAVSSDLPVNFLICMREDALAELDRFKGLVPNLFGNRLRLEHLDIEAAREAIELPVDKYNLLVSPPGGDIRIEPGLVDAVLEQVKTGQITPNQTGSGQTSRSSNGSAMEPRVETPYLQLVMTRLWDEEMSEGSSSLRLQTLDRLGGAERIVRMHVDGVLSEMSSDAQSIAAGALRYLVTPSGSKIALAVSDLADFTGHSEAELAPVVRELADPARRVLRTIPPPPGVPQTTRFEIFHDVLAPSILDWRARHEAATRTRRLEEEKRRAEAEARKQRRTARVFRVLALALALVTFIAATAAILAVRSERRAQRESSRALAESAFVHLTVNPFRSIYDALRAMDLWPNPGAAEALRRALFDSHLRAVLRGPDVAINGAAFDPQGRRVVTVGEDGSARIWDAISGEPILPVLGEGSLYSAAFGPKGDRVLLAGARGFRIVDATSGDVISKGPDVWIRSASFDPTGDRVLTVGRDGSASIWDAASGRLLGSLEANRVVLAAAFDPKGNRIVTAGRDGVRLWDAETRRPLQRLSGPVGEVNTVSFDPTGRMVLTAGEDGNARIWAVGDGEVRSELGASNSPLAAAVFSPDGSLVVTAGEDGMARVWDWVGGRQLLVLRNPAQRLTTVAFSARGSSIVTAGEEGTARVWRIDVGVRIGRGGARFSAASISPDGTRVVTAGDLGVQLWDARDGVPAPPILDWDDGSVFSASFAPDGASILAYGESGTAVVWDAETGTRLLDLPHARTAAFDADGSRLVVTWTDRPGGEVLDATTGSELASFGTSAGKLWTAEFSPDGERIVSVGFDGTARVWDPVAGEQLHVLGAQGDDVIDAVFDPTGGRVLTVDNDGAALRMWDLSTGEELFRLPHRQEISRSAGKVTFSPDGRSFATIPEGGQTTMVWDAETGQLVHELRGPTRIASVAFSPDGRWIAGGAQDGLTTWIWTTTTWRTVAFVPMRDDSVDRVAFALDGPILTHAEGGVVELHTCTSCLPLRNVIAQACVQLWRLAPFSARGLELCSRFEDRALATPTRAGP